MFHSSIIIDKEQDWKKFERAQMINERNRLIKKGVIVPAYKMQPQLLVKVDGAWKAEIKSG